MKRTCKKTVSLLVSLSVFWLLCCPVFAQKNSNGVTPIMSSHTASLETAESWARGRGATDEFVSLAKIYWQQAPEIGINPVMAYCQAAVETGYGKFGGIIDASFHNPCGLKVTDTSGFTDSDREPDAHKRFPDWQTGISAHLDHLALYAGAPGYPRADTYDPRHFSYLYGRCGNQIEYTDDAHRGLRGWTSAGNDNYGNLIISLMEQIEAAEPKEPEDNSKPVFPSDCDILCSCEKDSDDVFDFCQNSHGVQNSAITVVPSSKSNTFPGKDALYNLFYCRVGRNYGDGDYTKYYNFSKYYLLEALVFSQNDNTLVVSAGNEKNNMEWQYCAEVELSGGKWQRIEIKISDISPSAAQGSAEFSLDNVNLLHFAQTNSGDFSIKNLALVSQNYAENRKTAETAFDAAVKSIGRVNGRSESTIESAFEAKERLSGFINIENDGFYELTDILISSKETFESFKSIIKGDVDLDGKVTVGDALLSLQHSVGKIQLDDLAFYAADVHDNGQVTPSDALTVLQIAIGKIEL